MRMSDWSSDVCSSDLRPANIMGQAPFDGERALLEIIVIVRRHAGRVARAFEPLDRVDHEGGAAVNAAEAAGRRRHFQRIDRSEEHTSELQSLMRITYAVFCLTNKEI